MKLIIATTALAAVFAISSASAQTPPPTPESQGKVGTLTVQGIPPAKVLGAIDTSKLVDQPPPADDQKVDTTKPDQNLTAQVQAEQSAQVQAPLAKTANAKGVTTKPDPNDLTHSDRASAATGAVGVQTASLPPEVASTISDGKYTTKDLVQAQLEAVKNAPPLVQPTITTTTVIQPDQGSPVFDGAQRPGDWSQSASTPSNPG